MKQLSARRLGAVGAAIMSAAGAMAQGLDPAMAASSELFADALDRTSGLRAPTPVFTPRIGGQIVARFNVNLRDNAPPVDDVTIGGQLAQTKLNVTGNVMDESISYRLQVRFGESGGMPVLDDAHIDFKLEDEFSVRVGQFKPPVLREENMSDTKQLAANRSVMTGVFSQSRTQGVQLTYTTREVRVLASANDGIRTTNLDYTDGMEADFAFSGRFEYKIDGEWKQYDEFTSWRDSKYFGAVAAAVHYQEGGASFGTTSGQTDNVNLLLATADAMAKGNGWNVFAAGVFRQRKTSGTSRTTFDDMGFLIQGGWFVGPKWEVFARYDVVFPDGRRTLDDHFNTVTIGANKYITPNSHAAKLTFDVQWFLDAQGSQTLATQSTLTGLLSSAESGQIALRAQLQLAF